MARRVKEFIDIADHESLDDLIAKLKALRDALPEDAEAEMRLRGDEVFGRRLCISYFRDQTADEADCEARYADAYKHGRTRELERLQQELGVVRRAPNGKRKLRAVA